MRAEVKEATLKGITDEFLCVLYKKLVSMAEYMYVSNQIAISLNVGNENESIKEISKRIHDRPWECMLNEEDARKLSQFISENLGRVQIDWRIKIE